MTELLLDLDGVVFDFTQGIADAIGPSEFFDPANVLEWSLRTGDRDTDSAVFAAMRAPGFFAGLRPIPGAVSQVAALLDQEDARFCSTPLPSNPTCEQDKFDSVARLFGKRHAERMILTQDKTLSAGLVLVDDRPHITGEATPSWQQLVFDQPYNRHVEGNRITGWHAHSTAEVRRLLRERRG